MNDFGTVLNEDTELSDTDFDVLLLYLSRDSNAIAYDGRVRYASRVPVPAIVIIPIIIVANNSLRQSGSELQMILRHKSRSRTPPSRR